MPGPIDDCGALDDCVQGCGADAGCVAECRSRAPAPAAAQHAAFTGCAQAAGCSFGNRACLLFECAAETDACFGPRGGAALDCGAINDCLGPCMDNACVLACAEQGTVAGLEQFDVTGDCVDREMCGDDGRCQVARCGPELNACFGGVVYPRGNESCAQFNDCLGTCGNNDQFCVDACIERATPDAWLAFLELVDCAEATGCTNNCNQRCPAEWNACF
ncbi:MAG: hypothetical protein H6705_01280 [Myxococcales bacterium]|nr:hypothetical protein [Myxococcales bacterium]